LTFTETNVILTSIQQEVEDAKLGKIVELMLVPPTNGGSKRELSSDNDVDMITNTDVTHVEMHHHVSFSLKLKLNDLDIDANAEDLLTYFNKIMTSGLFLSRLHNIARSSLPSSNNRLLFIHRASLLTLEIIHVKSELAEEVSNIASVFVAISALCGLVFSILLGMYLYQRKTKVQKFSLLKSVEDKDNDIDENNDSTSSTNNLLPSLLAPVKNIHTVDNVESNQLMNNCFKDF